MQLNTRQLRTAASIAVLALAAGGASVIAQNAEDRAPNPLMQNLPMAVAETEGCLGIELAQTMSGKNVIFAWFENKAAAMNWYWSESHVQAMSFVGFDPKGHEPMKGVPDEGPILVIASIVQSDDPAAGGDLGVSQIAIELYQPLPGGAYANGRFAPEGVKVEGMADYSD